MFDKNWRRSTRGGLPIPRPANVATPCHTCPKSLDGRPNPESDLTAKNWRALQYCQAIRAVAGAATVDSIALRNAAVVEGALDAARMMLMRKLLTAVQLAGKV